MDVIRGHVHHDISRALFCKKKSCLFDNPYYHVCFALYKSTILHVLVNLVTVSHTIEVVRLLAYQDYIEMELFFNKQNFDIFQGALFVLA